MSGSSLASMVVGEDIETVKAKIQARYGFTPTDEYVKDLIQFISDMLSEEEEDADELYSDDNGEDDNGLPEE